MCIQKGEDLIGQIRSLAASANDASEIGFGIYNHAAEKHCEALVADIRYIQQFLALEVQLISEGKTKVELPDL